MDDVYTRNSEISHLVGFCNCMPVMDLFQKDSRPCFNFYCLNLFINLHILSPLGVPIRVQNLKDGTVHDKPLDIYLYLNKMGSVEQSVVYKK